MQQRTVLLFVLALVFGGLAALVAYQRSTRSAAEAAANSRLVVVAAIDIEYGAKITPEMLRQVPWPVSAMPEGAILQPTDAVGKVASATIIKGEPITSRRAVESLGGSSLASLITPGKRAMTVRVNDVIGVAGFLLPGNRVDVLGTPKKRNDEEAETETLVENLKVLAVDQQAQTNKDDPVIVRAVTVEVTPEEAEQIVQATNNGSVQLVLRNPLEEVAEKPEAEPEPAPEPEKVARKSRKREDKKKEDVPPKPPETVTVIRGVDPEKVPVKY
jgi:pilus assembly protein CpaB